MDFSIIFDLIFFFYFGGGENSSSCWKHRLISVTTERLHLEEPLMEGWSQQSKKNTQHSFSVEQKDAEGVIVVLVIAEEAAGAQADRHHVPSLQVDGHHRGSAVLLILLVCLALLAEHQAVHLQTGAGGQSAAGGSGVAVDGQGQTVDARARDSEGTAAAVVAVAQVDEDVLVDDVSAGGEGAQAPETLVRVKGHRRSDGAGWRQTCKVGEKEASV